MPKSLTALVNLITLILSLEITSLRKNDPGKIPPGQLQQYDNKTNITLHMGSPFWNRHPENLNRLGHIGALLMDGQTSDLYHVYITTPSTVWHQSWHHRTAVGAVPNRCLDSKLSLFSPMMKQRPPIFYHPHIWTATKIWLRSQRDLTWHHGELFSKGCLENSWYNVRHTWASSAVITPKGRWFTSNTLLHYSPNILVTIVYVKNSWYYMSHTWASLAGITRQMPMVYFTNSACLQL